MIRTVSTAFLRAIREDQSAVSSLDVHRGNSTASLALLGGNVTEDMDDATRRSMQCTVYDEETAFADLEDLLDPYLSTIEPKRGIIYPDGSEEVVSLGVQHPTELSIQEVDGGPVFHLTALDSSSRASGPLANPVYIPVGTPFDEAITKLLQSKMPGVSMMIGESEFTTPTLLIPDSSNAWTESRKLAAAAGLDLWVSRDNQVVAAPRPLDPDVDPDWEFVEGENATFWDPKRQTRRDDYPNVVVVEGTHPNFPGIRAVVWDDDPASRTYRYGPYGEVVRKIQTEKVTSTDQAQAMAARELARLLGPQYEITLECVPNPALEVGDTVLVTRERVGLVAVRMIVCHLETPLLPEDSQQVTLRRTILTVDGTGTPIRSS